MDYCWCFLHETPAGQLGFPNVPNLNKRGFAVLHLEQHPHYRDAHAEGLTANPEATAACQGSCRNSRTQNPREWEWTDFRRSSRRGSRHTQRVSDGNSQARQGDVFGNSSNFFFPQPATPPAFFPPTDSSGSLTLPTTSYPSSTLSTKSHPICSLSDLYCPCFSILHGHT